MIQRWSVGDTSPRATPDYVLALNATELQMAESTGTAVVPFHRAMSSDVPRATDAVDVYVPTYRGKSLIPVLAWLVVARLATPATQVTWYMGRQQGPDSVQGLLHSLGWALTQSRAGRIRQLTGSPPATAELPEPPNFTATIGTAKVCFAADYGVFSPNGIDAGTDLLLQVALTIPAVRAVADIGTGYGALAIGIVRNGVATRAFGSDVDSIALWLADRNAQANGTPLDVVCSDDPTAIEPTPLTVCNVPTHINADQTRRFMKALAQRARSGRLLVVVHASLEARYVGHLEREGIRVTRHPGPAHVVLDSGA